MSNPPSPDQVSIPKTVIYPWFFGKMNEAEQALSTPILPLTRRSGLSRGGLMPTVSIPLNHGKTALIDDQDAERVSGFSWYAHFQHDRWYVQTWRQEIRRPLSLHRFILDAPPDILVDHRSGDGLDCRRANLRECSSFGNNQNSRLKRSNTSGFKGVSFKRASGKWVAQIVAFGRHQYLGLFESPVDAALAYDAAARIHFGEFGRFNFPLEDEQGVL